MTRHAHLRLQCHPLTRSAVAPVVKAMPARQGNGDLAVYYSCAAPLDALRIPLPARPGAADELWRHTCCELFVGMAGDPAYREFNFSPSGQWAVYGFSTRRVRDGYQPDAAPRIAFSCDREGWTLAASIPQGLLPEGPLEHAELSLTVVLETMDGGLSYWALAHPGEKPDFHDRAGFILRGSEIPTL